MGIRLDTAILFDFCVCACLLSQQLPFCGDNVVIERNVALSSVETVNTSSGVQYIFSIAVPL